MQGIIVSVCTSWWCVFQLCLGCGFQSQKSWISHICRLASKSGWKWDIHSCTQVQGLCWSRQQKTWICCVFVFLFCFVFLMWGSTTSSTLLGSFYRLYAVHSLNREKLQYRNTQASRLAKQEQLHNQFIVLGFYTSTKCHTITNHRFLAIKECPVQACWVWCWLECFMAIEEHPVDACYVWWWFDELWEYCVVKCGCWWAAGWLGHILQPWPT